jgi:DNA-binding NarL/FixJ family response regulator
MGRKKILIVEDRKKQRKALHDALERRGFDVYEAGDVETARGLIAKLAGEIDVMVLDMHLDDRRYPGITGADLGMEAMKAQPTWAPEFLIHSDHQSDMNYYRLAMRLRVAAYLYKSDYDVEQLIPHVRALALRRALSVERADLAPRIEKIGESCQTQSEAIGLFCREILIPELSACLGAPFLLLRDNEQTVYSGGDLDRSLQADPVYETIEVLTFAANNGMEPFQFDAATVPLVEESRTSQVVQKLDGGAFLSLTPNKDLPLILGILRPDNGAFPLADDPGELARALINYLKPAVLEQFLRLSAYWVKNKAKRDARLAEISRIFLYIGQKQLSILEEACNSGQWTEQSLSYQKLHALAIDLNATGAVLSSVKSARTEELPIEEVAEFARWVWIEIGGRGVEGVLQVDGNCWVKATKEDLFLILSRILQWFMQRFVEYPPEANPEILISCGSTEEGSVIRLEDRSHRLSESLRRQLFDSFNQTRPSPQLQPARDHPDVFLPLYLAKALVEEKYNGRLEERSEEIAGDCGHRFIIRFQPQKPPCLEGSLEDASIAA